MKNPIIYFLLFTVIVSCSGCGSFSTFEKGQMLSVLSALGTGFIGYKASEGNKHQDLIAGASAVGGYTAAEIIRANVKGEIKEEFRAGYDLGAGDTVKSQYWIIQNRQKEDDSRTQADVRYYEFPGAEERGGVNYAPHKIIMRTEQ